MGTPSNPSRKNDYHDMSSQNIYASMHPDRESNVEIFKRYNPDYNMPMTQSRMTNMS